MEQGVVTEILEAVQARAVVINGKGYATDELHNAPLPIEPPFPTVPLLTLDSVQDYLKAAQVSNENEIWASAGVVQVVSGPKGENRRRDVFAKAESGVHHPNLGTYMDLESFRIELLTRYIDNGNRDEVLKFISKINDSNVKTSEDTGVGQIVTIKSGIAGYAEAMLPSPIRLNPIRTFIEVEQPQGVFVFRLKQVKDQLPQAALFELHTNWQRAATVNVKAYLDAKGTNGVPVFA